MLERLRKAGLRPTTARVSIVQAVEACAVPMTAEDVFRAQMRRGISMGFGTAYRALSELTTAGLVARVLMDERHRPKFLYSKTLRREEVSLYAILQTEIPSTCDRT